MGRIVVRHSELKDGRQCPLKHRLRWIDGWVSDHQSDPSQLGTAWHAVLQRHYLMTQIQQQKYGYQVWRRTVLEEVRLDNIGSFHGEVIGQVWDFFNEVTETLTDEQDATLRWMYEGYLERFGLDPDWEVLMVETDLTVPFIEPSGRKSARFAYQFHADLVVRDHSLGGRVVVVDHKSTGQPLNQHDVDLDDQFGLYTWALGQLGYDVIAPVCSQAKTQRLKRAMTIDERFVRINSFRTMVEQANIAADALRTAKRLYSKANLDEPDSAPNPRTCGWSCEFKEVHLMIRKSVRGREAAPAALLARGFTQEER